MDIDFLIPCDVLFQFFLFCAAALYRKCQKYSPRSTCKNEFHIESRVKLLFIYETHSLNFITEPILYPFNGSLNKSCLMNKKWGFLDTFEYHKQTWNYGIFAIWWRERWTLGWTPTKTASRKWAFFVVDLHCRECTIFLCHLRISFIFSLHHNSFMWSL